MNKIFKFFIVIICMFLMLSCQKNNLTPEETSDLIEYPKYEIGDYNKMDTYIFNETIDDIKYVYTYYFDNDMCVNSKEELTFKDVNLAKDFYDESVNLEDYINMQINSNVVTYYYNPEYFIYMMYPKEMLIEILNKHDEIDE